MKMNSWFPQLPHGDAAIPSLAITEWFSETVTHSHSVARQAGSDDDGRECWASKNKLMISVSAAAAINRQILIAQDVIEDNFNPRRIEHHGMMRERIRRRRRGGKQKGNRTGWEMVALPQRGDR